MFRFLTAALVAAFFVPAPVAAHDHYGRVMNNPVTEYCGGPKDCRPLRPSELPRRNGPWRVNGHIVPDRNVHSSGAPDALHHACFYQPALEVPRCLFIPGMS